MQGETKQLWGAGEAAEGCETSHPGCESERQATVRAGLVPIRRVGAAWLVAIFLVAAGLGLSGCTVFPEQKNPSLAMTTSAEQTERIFWEMAQKKQWQQLGALLAPNVVWTAPGKTLTREQIVPYLQTLDLTGYMINNVSVKPNGPDMTVTYMLQLPAAAGAVKSFTEVSVWQQLRHGMTMTVHSEQPLP